MNFIPFRYKILGAFLALLAAVLMSSLWLVSARQRDFAHEAIVAQLDLTRGVFNSLLSRREDQLTTSLRLLGSDFGFKQAVATGDAGTITSAARNIQGRIGADGVWVTDDDAVLSADTSGINAAGASLEDVALVENAINEQPGFAMMLMGGRAYQLAAAPILAPDVIGVLLAGFEIDDRFALALKKVTSSEVSFAAGGRIFASTLAPDLRAVLESQFDRVPMGSEGFIDAGGRRWIVLRSAVSPEITAYIQRSWTDALRPLEELQRLLAAIGGFGLLLTALVGYFIAGGVTRSMEMLAAATKELAAGRYDTRVDIRQNDEIGQLGEAFNGMVAGLKDKEKMRSVLNKAVSKEIAEELLKRGELQLGGEERTVTLLFSDIRDFTTISERLKPQELVTQLNDYFIRMGRAIEGHQGVIDKYVGDAIMALFGAPVDSPEDADHALRAALGMARALEEFNRERAGRGLEAWAMGVGLNTGIAVAGNMGSENRSSYTAIGDTVNLASRLEGLTKRYGVPIIAARSVRDAATGDYAWRSLDLVRVKGKSEPVEIFELLAEGGAAPPWLADYEAAVADFRARRFAEAGAKLDAVLERAAADRPARMLRERAAELAAAAPPEDWEPAVTMREK